MKDAGKWKQRQIAKSFPSGSLDIFFVFGQKKACPPIERDGGNFCTCPVIHQNSLLHSVERKGTKVGFFDFGGGAVFQIDRTLIVMINMIRENHDNHKNQRSISKSCFVTNDYLNF